MEAIEKRTGGKWLAVMGMLLLRAQIDIWSVDIFVGKAEIDTVASCRS